MKLLTLVLLLFYCYRGTSFTTGTTSTTQGFLTASTTDQQPNGVEGGVDNNDGEKDDNKGNDDDDDDEEEDDDDDLLTLVLIIFGTLIAVIILVLAGVYVMMKVQTNKVTELKKRKGKKPKQTNPKVKDLPGFPVFERLPDVTSEHPHPPPSITSGHISKLGPLMEIQDVDQTKY